MSPLKNKFVLVSFALLLALASLVDRLHSCDTWVALPDATRSGFTLLGKNSDRVPFDCQPLLFHPGREWPDGSVVDLGRLTIPQVRKTFATLGSSPYWCYGYEEGINEYGVAIGNEGIRTKVFSENLVLDQQGKGPEPGPTGMDLIRLGLERGRTAREALDTMTKLVERYGQFGSGLPTLNVATAGYENSFIIADPRESWILETAGTHWVARRVEKGVASISNTLSIEQDFHLASSGLRDYAAKQGWWAASEPFDFTRAYLDDSPIARAQRELSLPRASCSARLLEERAGDITLRRMMGVARDRSSNPAIDQDVTASSCVAVLPGTGSELPVFWWCPTTPSNSCYVPFFVHGSRLPEIVSRAGTHGRRIVPPSRVEQDEFSSDSYWWQFRDLCDQARTSYKDRNAVIRAVFDPLEKEFAEGVPGVVKKAVALREAGNREEAAAVLDRYTAACIDRVLIELNSLRDRFTSEAVEVPENYRPFIGAYMANFGQFSNVVFKVLMQNDRMAVEIPGQRIYELNEPDGEGKWVFALSDQVAVSFDQGPKGEITGMKLHQSGMSFTLPRIREEAEKDPVGNQGAAAGEATLEQRLDRLSARLDDERESQHIPGMALAVVKDGKVVLARGFGYADLERKKPVTPETLFAIGSTTKAFTATAIGMLVDEGKMNWDDPVARFLPDFKPAIDSDDPDTALTIRDLLCHRTGFTRMSMLFGNGEVSREQVLATAAEAEPWTGFRKKFLYNNIMFLAAGVAGGKAAGSDWDTLIRERILEPLGMDDSNTSILRCAGDGRLSLGYQWEEDLETYRHLPMRNVDCVGPAGSINSNVVDMAKWVRFLLDRGVCKDRRLISEDSLSETWKKQMDIGGGASYGLGWMLHDWKGQPVVEHGGNIDGFAAQVALLPESNLGFVLLANVTGPPLQQQSMSIVWEAMLGEWIAADDGSGTAVDFTPYLGEYLANFGVFNNVKFKVIVKNGRLAIDVPRQMVFELNPPNEEGKWTYTISDQLAVSFLRDDTGRIIAMKQYQQGIVVELPRADVVLPPEIPLDELDRYMGDYYCDELKETAELVIKRNCLALAIPGQKTYELRAPNAEGRWNFRVIDRCGVSFEEGEDGRVVAMTYYEGEGRLQYTRAEKGDTTAMPTVADILALRGGDRLKDAIESMGAFRLEGIVGLPNCGLKGKATWTTNGLDRFRQDLDFGIFGCVRITLEGEQAWLRHPHGRSDALRGKFHEQARHTHPAAIFGDWRNFFESIKVLRLGEIDGRKTCVLKLKGKEAPDYTVHVDAFTGDLLMTEFALINPGSRMQLPTTIRYEDYREVHGLRIPFRIITSSDYTGKTVLQFKKIETRLERGGGKK